MAGTKRGAQCRMLRGRNLREALTSEIGCKVTLVRKEEGNAVDLMMEESVK